MDNRLFRRIEHFTQSIKIAALVEMVAQSQRFQISVAVELFVVGVGYFFKLGLVFFAQNRYGVASEVRAGHGDNMSRGVAHDFVQDCAQTIVFFRRHMMEFVNRHQRVIKCLDICEFVESKAESRMGADQNLVVAAHKADKGIHFALVFIVAAAGAEIVFRLDAPIGKKAVFRQFGIGKRAADGHFGYGDNRLFDALMGQLVQSQKHQRAGFA